jgi:uncharacterized membrane protein
VHVGVLIAAGLYEWLLFLHIIAAMIWLGGLVLLNVLAALVLRSGERESVARLIGTLRIVGPATLAPSMLGVVVFGIWLVLDSDVWGFSQTWIVLALVLFAAAFLIGAVFQSRTAIGAQRAAESGDLEEAVRQFTRWAWGMRVILVLLLVIVWDMVFKPGL